MNTTATVVTLAVWGAAGLVCGYDWMDGRLNGRRFGDTVALALLGTVCVILGLVAGPAIVGAVRQ